MELEQRRWIRPEHLNIENCLFGGHLLSWMDEESSMLAYQCILPGERLVTVGMDATFTSPGKQGDLLRFLYKVVHIGTSSITILCEVYNDKTESMIVMAYATLVSVDSNEKLQNIPLTGDVDIATICKNPEWDKVVEMKKGRINRGR
jgi:acyl-CoA hydrolase